MIFIGCFFSYFSWISTLNEAATRAKEKVRVFADPISQSLFVFLFNSNNEKKIRSVLNSPTDNEGKGAENKIKANNFLIRY